MLRVIGLLALLAATGLVVPAASGSSFPVRLGDPVRTVVASLGAPTRTIETGDGKILFYQSTMMFIKNGYVDFISVADPSGVRVSATLTTPEAIALASQPRALSSLPTPRPESRPPLDSQQQRLVTRVREFAVTRTYASMCREFVRAMPLAQAGNVVGMRDARGHALPAYGNHANAAWYAMGVEINQLVLSD